MEKQSIISNLTTDSSEIRNKVTLLQNCRPVEFFARSMGLRRLPLECASKSSRQELRLDRLATLQLFQNLTHFFRSFQKLHNTFVRIFSGLSDTPCCRCLCWSQLILVFLALCTNSWEGLQIFLGISPETLRLFGLLPIPAPASATGILQAFWENLTVLVCASRNAVVRIVTHSTGRQI